MSKSKSNSAEHITSSASGQKDAPITHASRTEHTLPKRRLQSARTLMRSAVTRPGKQARLRAKAPLDSRKSVAKTNDVSPKLSVQHVDQARLARASQVAQSEQLVHFNRIEPHPYIAPANQRVSAVPPRPTSGHPQLNLLDQAVQRASSHKQRPVKLARRQSRLQRRLVSAGGLVAAIAFFVVVASYQNIGSIRVHTASNRAGIAASLPAYKPAGYSLGTISSGAGTVTTEYISTTDTSRSYTLNQTASSLTDAQLRDTIIVPADSHYLLFATNDKTVFIYTPDTASWLKNGVRYTISGNGSLSNQQLLDIANSL